MFQSHFTGYQLDPYQIKDNVDKLWNEFGIPMWVTEFTWSRGDIDDPNHEIHAKQLENYYRYPSKHSLIVKTSLFILFMIKFLENSFIKYLIDAQIDVQSGKHKWLFDVAFFKWKRF